jgi:hypothetical protein
MQMAVACKNGEGPGLRTQLPGITGNPRKLRLIPGVAGDPEVPLPGVTVEPVPGDLRANDVPGVGTFWNALLRMVRGSILGNTEPVPVSCTTTCPLGMRCDVDNQICVPNVPARTSSR